MTIGRYFKEAEASTERQRHTVHEVEKSNVVRGANLKVEILTYSS